MLKSLFFCENCRGKVQKASDLHFIEDHSDRGFCSEKCIMEFYRPYLNWLEKEEIKLREELNIDKEETYAEITSSQIRLKSALESPDEIWILSNETEQQFFTHIAKLNLQGRVLYYILICSYVDNEPSFVFYRTATTHIELVDKYRRDSVYRPTNEKLDATSKVPSEIFEMVEQKKSEMLANLLAQRSVHDIAFEEFTNYDEYFNHTIEEPDEVFENEDDTGDTLYTYIKSFKLGDESFFYVVVGYLFESDEQVLIPIISFPSVDKKIYPLYAVGTKTLNKLKN